MNVQNTIEETLDETKAKASHAFDNAAAAGQQFRDDAARNVDKTVNKVEDAVDGMAKKAQDAVDDIRHTDAREMIDDAKTKAGELGEQAKAKAGELGEQAADKADDAMHATGEHLSDLADTVRAKAPSSGPVGQLAASGADALDRSGTYLQNAELSDVRKDLETVIRRHPVESLVVGLGLGFLVARAMRS